MTEWPAEFLGALLLVVACAGHVALIVCSHNWWYAAALSRKNNKIVRAILAVLMLGGLGLLMATLGSTSLPFSLDFSFADPGKALLSLYVALCWPIGLVWLPLNILKGYLRKVPTHVQSNHTESLDVAAKLGYRPIGTGKHRLIARLPRNEIFHIDFTERTLALPALPRAWDGLSILHLSDLHFCGTPDRGFYREAMDRCAAWQPDLVAVTGDIVDTIRHYRWIVPFLGRLRWNITACAILGNHDYWYDPDLVRRRLRKLNMNVLGNSWMTLEVRGQPLVVIGHEGPWFRPAPDLGNCPAEGFRLCLSHTPDNIRWAQRHKIDLMLSGHNHGGQIRFPVIGSVFVPSRYGRRYDCGNFFEPPTYLHVTRGLAGQHPVRYNCRPEIVKLVLKCACV
jgi:predicted MPP superfamily phosphohydrolase